MEKRLTPISLLLPMVQAALCLWCVWRIMWLMSAIGAFVGAERVIDPERPDGSMSSAEVSAAYNALQQNVTGLLVPIGCFALTVLVSIILAAARLRPKQPAA